MSGTRGTHGERRCAYRILVGKTGGERSLEDPDVDGKTIYYNKCSRNMTGGVDWFDLAQD
jgi:hypothetical protein